MRRVCGTPTLSTRCWPATPAGGRDAAALRDGRVTLDWRTLKARVDALAGDLAERGPVAGDRLSIWMSNRCETVIAFLACSRLGIACNPSLLTGPIPAPRLSAC